MYDLSYITVRADGSSTLSGVINHNTTTYMFLHFDKFGLKQLVQQSNTKLDLPKRVTSKDNIHFVQNQPNNPIVNITYQKCSLSTDKRSQLEMVSNILGSKSTFKFISRFSFG